MKVFIKSIGIILSMLIIISVLPISAGATEPKETVSVTVISQQGLFADETREYNVGDRFTVAINLDMKGEKPDISQIQTLFDHNGLKVVSEKLHPILSSDSDIFTATNISETYQTDNDAVFFCFSTAKGADITTKSTLVEYTVEVLNVPGTSQIMTVDYQVLCALNPDPTKSSIDYITNAQDDPGDILPDADTGSASYNEIEQQVYGVVQHGAENLFEVSVDVSASTVEPTGPATDSGTTGECTWEYYSSTGTLKISGNGKMEDYNGWSTSTPWIIYRVKIKTVQINSGVTSIGSASFDNCTSLTSVTIADSVTSIGFSAFDDCTSLKSITIPDRVTSIDGLAFSGCTSLTNITIPDSVTSIAYNAFPSCKSLTDIKVSANNNSYISEGGVLFNKDKTRLICYPAGKTNPDYTILNSVTSIGDWAFYECTNLTSITIPNSVKSIGMWAFNDCTSLTSITIPDNVKYIYEYAFSYCTNLTSVKIGNGVTSIGNNAFDSCKSLTNITVSKNNNSFISEKEILFNKDKTNLILYPAGKANTTYTIPNSVTSIENSAFEYCEKLSSITIPNSVTSIGSFAFNHCNNLTSVTIGNGVTDIGYMAFSGCTSLKDVYYTGTKTEWNNITIDSKNECLTNANIHYEYTPTETADASGTTGECTWEYYSSTGTLKISGNGAMEDSTSNNAPWKSYCEEIKDVQIGSGVTNIGNYAFQSCTNLTSVTIPDSVTSIGMSAFDNCTNLASITIPNSVKSIGKWAFEYCEKLSSITIPNSVTSIGSFAFKYCNNLTSVTIGNGVTSIGNYAFDFCTSLTNIEVSENNNSFISEDEILFNKDKTNLIRYPAKRTGTNYTIPNSVATIDKGAFGSCANLTNIIIPNSVTNIGYSAFDDCTGLEYVYYTGTQAEWNNITIDEYNECLTSAKIITTTPTGTATDSGTTGNCTWEYYSSADKLIISGNSAMGDYSHSDNAPWDLYSEEIKYVQINSGVTNIGNHAFYDYNNLIHVIIPDSITSIGNYAFCDCKNLTNVTIPDRVTSIGSFAFTDCTSLTNITIPNSVTSIGEYAFRDCTSLKKIEVSDNNRSYLSESGVLFNKDQTNLICYPAGKTSSAYTIPNGVTDINICAFSVCTNLTSIAIPNSVKSIEDSAFSLCTSLTSVTIPDSVTSIGRAVFGNCTSLTSVAIGNGVTSIGELAFNDCNSLTDITVSVNNTSYISEKGVLFDEDKTKLIRYPAGKISTTYTIPNSVTRIGDYAFSDCSSLTNVTIPNSVTSINEWVFSNCTSLTSVTIPDSVKYIGDMAFYECTSLTSVTIPNSVKSIGWSAFGGCTGLKDVYYTGTKTEWDSITIDSYNGYLTSAEIHYEYTPTETADASGTTGECTWEYYSSTGTLKISGNGAMGDYSYSSDVPWKSYREKIKAVQINSDVTSIGNLAFIDCTNLTSITIPESVKSIGITAFRDCTSLKSITIPYGVTSIGWQTFYGCTSLTSVIIPNSVTVIGELAFNSCTNLTSVTMSNRVTSIGRSAFEDCTSLTSIKIPDSVTSIGGGAFDSCKSLTKIDVSDNNRSYLSESGVLFNKDKTNLICYPAGKTSIDYTIPNSVTSIGGDAFRDCTILTRVTIPDNVTSIGSSAFRDCTSLISVTMGNGVTSIDDYTFYDCASLTSVTMGNRVTCIGWYAFSHCTSLTSIIIPDSVTSIESSAFSSCTSLSSITIPNSVTSIGRSAFYECTSLKDVYYTGTETEWNKITVEEDNECLTSATIHYETTPTETADESGTTGECTWEYYSSTGTLNISGNGAMGDYSTSNNAPWQSYCEEIKAVKINRGVTNIGDYAFYFCSNLTSITIPDSVTSIGKSAFSNNNSLTYITIPNSVTTIGDFAFEYCKKLSSISIPNKVKSIGDFAFDYCDSLTNITVSANNPSYISENGLLINKNKTNLIRYPAGKTSTAYTIPNSVTTIDKGAFNDCANLTSITITNKVTSIGKFAFENCTGLKDVYYKGTETEWNNVSVEDYNENLTQASIHFTQSTPENKTTISLAKTYASIYVGSKTTIKASVKNGSGSTQYTTDNYNVAKVSSTGVVTGVGKGTAVITVRNNGVSAKFTITVKKKSQTIKGVKSSYTKVYGSKSFKLNPKPTGDGAISFGLSNRKVVSISYTGKITIKGCGKVTITISASSTEKYNEATKKITIIVKPKKVNVSYGKSGKKLLIKWKKQNNCSGYEVEVSAKSKNSSKIKRVYKAKLSAKKSSTKISGIKSGNIYIIRVRAYKKISGETLYGKWAKNDIYLK